MTHRLLMKKVRSTEFLKGLEQILQHLVKGGLVDRKETPSSLASVILQLSAFQDACLSGKSEAPCLRIPLSFFCDLSQNGTLSEILKCCFDFKYIRQWRRFDFSSPSKQEEFYLMFKEIFSRLGEKGLWEAPKVYLSPSLSNLKFYQELVVKKSGILVKEINEATHCVSKTFFVKDSARAPKNCWFLTPRWLYDLSGLNEWGKESDYLHINRSREGKGDRRKKREDDEGYEEEKENEDTKEDGEKVKEEKAEEGGDEELEEIDDVEEEEMEEEGEEESGDEPPLPPSPSPPKLKRDRGRGRPPKKRTPQQLAKEEAEKERKAAMPKRGRGRPPTKRKAEEEKEEEGEEDEGEEEEEEEKVVAEGPKENDGEITREKENLKRKRSDVVNGLPPGPIVFANLSESSTGTTFTEKLYVAPCAFRPAWYRRSILSTIEEIAFDGVFEESGFTRERYIFLRDGLIDFLSKSQKQGRTFQECCKSLGHVGELLRVCQFLRHWSIISTEFEMFFPSLSSIKALNRLDFLDPIRLPEDLVTFQPQYPLPDLITETDPMDLDCCTFCGEKCNNQFHCLRDARERLCGSCFAKGRYDKEFSSSDFEQFLSLPDPWSTPEVETLLQSVEIHGEDWVESAKSVPSKSLNECVLKFIRIPLQEESHEAFNNISQASLSGILAQAAAELKSNLSENVAVAGARAAIEFFRDRIDIPSLGPSEDIFKELMWIERAVEYEICNCLPVGRDSLFLLKSGAHLAFLGASSEKAKEEAEMHLNESNDIILLLQELESEKVKKMIEAVNRDINNPQAEPEMEKLLDRALQTAKAKPPAEDTRLFAREQSVLETTEAIKVCYNCKTSSSYLWRRPKTLQQILCDTCVKYYYKKEWNLYLRRRKN